MFIHTHTQMYTFRGLLGGSDNKESAFSVGDPGSIPGSGRSPGEGNGYPLQYSCLGNLMERGIWRPTVHGVAESDMTEHTYKHTHTYAHTHTHTHTPHIPSSLKAPSPNTDTF